MRQQAPTEALLSAADSVPDLICHAVAGKRSRAVPVLAAAVGCALGQLSRQEAAVELSSICMDLEQRLEYSGHTASSNDG